MDEMFNALPHAAMGNSRDSFLAIGEEPAEMRLGLFEAGLMDDTTFNEFTGFDDFDEDVPGGGGGEGGGEDEEFGGFGGAEEEDDTGEIYNQLGDGADRTYNAVENNNEFVHNAPAPTASMYDDE